MSKRDNDLLITDMLEAIQKIKKYTDGMTFQTFLKDEKTIDAVVRNFEIIGEAANRLDEDFRNQYGQIEWNRIRGFRNRIVHHYFGIDYEIVWEIIVKDLEKLQNHLQEIFDDLNSG